MMSLPKGMVGLTGRCEREKRDRDYTINNIGIRHVNARLVLLRVLLLYFEWFMMPLAYFILFLSINAISLRAVA